jgi:hypothetical protein
MKNLLLLWIMCVGLSFPSVYAGCLYPKGGAPEVPDPNKATDREMMEARLNVERYVSQAEKFAICSKRSSDKRAERTLKKAARVAEKYNRAHRLYTIRKSQQE